jgi:hypothetical protein
MLLAAESAGVLATLLAWAATTGVVSVVAETARIARTSGIIRLAFDIFVFMCRVLLTALQARSNMLQSWFTNYLIPFLL